MKIINSIGMEFCEIPAGSFLMGSQEDEEGGRLDERPQHEVTFKEGFWVGKYPVTQAEYEAVMGENPSSVNGDRLPVETVSWEKVAKFCRRLTFFGHKDGSLPLGWVYRLPSEAEWEYACRAGSTGPLHGNLDKVARYWRESYRRPRPVGELEPNAWGLHDMLGSVWVWCQDRWHESYSGAPNDGSARTSGDNLGRLIRGGLRLTGVAERHRVNVYGRYKFVGFRVVASPRKDVEK